MPDSPADARASQPAFIVFEGLDGAGTTTQAFLLATALRARGLAVEVTKEPTNGPFGSILRQIIEGRIRVDARTLAIGFAADRADHLANDANGIEKALQGGSTVICDRYLLSSLAYQHDQGLSFETILNHNRDLRVPDLTIFFQAEATTCAERLWSKSRHPELFHEVEQLAAIAENYLAAIDFLGDAHPIAIVSAEGSPDQVHDRVLGVLAERLDGRLAPPG